MVNDELAALTDRVRELEYEVGRHANDIKDLLRWSLEAATPPPDLAPDELVECPWCHGRGDSRQENNKGWTCSQCDGEHEVPRSVAELHPDYEPPPPLRPIDNRIGPNFGKELPAPDEDDPYPAYEDEHARWGQVAEVYHCTTPTQYENLKVAVAKAIELDLASPADSYPTREEVAEWDAVYRGDPAPDEAAKHYQLGYQYLTQALNLIPEGADPDLQIESLINSAASCLMNLRDLAAPADRAVVPDWVDCITIHYTEDDEWQVAFLTDTDSGDTRRADGFGESREAAWQAALRAAPAGADTTGEGE